MKFFLFNSFSEIFLTHIVIFLKYFEEKPNLVEFLTITVSNNYSEREEEKTRGGVNFVESERSE